METWKAMYAVVWASFLQILLVLFSPLGQSVTVAVHVVIGAAVLGLAFFIYRAVRATACPDRIKRITRATRDLAVLQGALGVALALGTALSWGSLYVDLVSLVHVGNALAIITQASSSATAYDMWEEKEFLAPPAVV
ncbi:MAG: hypothetical protein ABSF83_14290 [Nitrososphaerales archaeon]|jgi:hypothetical protein